MAVKNTLDRKARLLVHSVSPHSQTPKRRIANTQSSENVARIEKGLYSKPSRSSRLGKTRRSRRRRRAVATAPGRARGTAPRTAPGALATCEKGLPKYTDAIPSRTRQRNAQRRSCVKESRLVCAYAERMCVCSSLRPRLRVRYNPVTHSKKTQKLAPEEKSKKRTRFRKHT